MKVIEMGTKITSNDFGNGYVVRTLIDTATNQRYVVIRKEVDNDLIFCKYPHAVNHLFLLPPDFSQHETHAASIMNRRDAFYDPYYPDHRYERIELCWQERMERQPVNDYSPKQHEPKKISQKELELSLRTKDFKMPAYLDFDYSSTSQITSQSNSIHSNTPPIEPINKPLLSLNDFGQMKYELFIPDKRTAVPPEELSAICDKDAPPPSYDPWDMWAENLDRD